MLRGDVPTITNDGVIVHDLQGLNETLDTVKADGLVPSDTVEQMKNAAAKQHAAQGYVDLREMVTASLAEPTSDTSRFMMFFGAGIVVGIVIGASIYASKKEK